MKLRRFISMMLIVTMLTVFVGCGNKDDRTQAAKELNLSGPITVNVWYNDSAYESYLEFVARQFKKSNELVTVKPVYIEADSYINYIYDESVRNNNACDIYFLTSEEIEKAYLSGLTSENDMYPEVYNEDVYGKAATEVKDGKKAEAKTNKTEQKPKTFEKKNNEINYYSLGDDVYPVMLEELKKAKKFIFIEYFIINNGTMWQEILDILKEKANSGLDVRVLYDDMGSFAMLPSNYPKLLGKYGIKCMQFNKLSPFAGIIMNNRDHRKMMIIDGHTAFSGGERALEKVGRISVQVALTTPGCIGFINRCYLKY